MKKEYLFDLIRRVKEVSGVSLPIIVGSQCLYAATAIKETAYEGALVQRLERFENHLRSQRHINYNLTPIRELLARLK